MPEGVGYFDLRLTTLVNQQGADRGTQYRSIIFHRNGEELAVAQRVIAEINELLEGRVVTQLALFEAFYPAGPEHQNYYRRNQGKPYCEGTIEPKLTKLRQSFTTWLKEGDINAQKNASV